MFLWKETSQYKNSLVLGPWGPKQYIFNDYFYSNHVRKLRFHLFLLFHVRKRMTSSFYLKWTEFTRNCELYSNCGCQTTKLNKPNLLRVWQITQGFIEYKKPYLYLSLSLSLYIYICMYWTKLEKIFRWLFGTFKINFNKAKRTARCFKQHQPSYRIYYGNKWYPAPIPWYHDK